MIVLLLGGCLLSLGSDGLQKFSLVEVPLFEEKLERGEESQFNFIIVIPLN